MAKPPDRSSTEARWPVLISIIGLGGSSLALPEPLVLGPRWLIPAGVGVLLVPTVWAYFSGRHRLDKILGYGISVIVTLALVGSLARLIESVPSMTQAMISLLCIAILASRAIGLL
ncbi:MAG: hypothetical protein WEB59_08480 [Thermoanaerobaculia bacterium]